MSKDPPDRHDAVDCAHKTGGRGATTPLAGLIQGGLGGAEDELLEDGQEEVFSRFEVERGIIEHHAGEEPVRSIPVVRSASVFERRLKTDDSR